MLLDSSLLLLQPHLAIYTRIHITHRELSPPSHSLLVSWRVHFLTYIRTYIYIYTYAMCKLSYIYKHCCSTTGILCFIHLFFIFFFSSLLLSHSYSCSGNSLPPARRQTLLHFLRAFAPPQ